MDLNVLPLPNVTDYSTNKIYTKVVNIKRVNADFLNSYIFKGSIPVKSKFSRTEIELPLCIFVNNPYNKLQMAGLGYYIESSPGDFLGGTRPPTYTRGVVALPGKVEIDVLSEDPDYRDDIMREVISAYCSHEGQCWFSNHLSLVEHGYNITGSTETEFEQSINDKIHYLYLSTLNIDFFYDLTVVDKLGYIREIREQATVVTE
jgi:hypothetical protein